MKFTYQEYKNLLNLIKESNYNFCSYKNYKNYKNPCIIRHDVDYSMEKIEYEANVKSTYFILLSTDFYNPFSLNNRKIINYIKSLGHEIGLHFDETIYDVLSKDSLIQAVLKEKELLGQIIGNEVECVSMHRPSKWILDSDLKIPTVINSYSKEFFHDFKYVSDSRMHWREDIIKYIKEKSFQKLHILTHPFWYFDKEKEIKDILTSFIDSACDDRYKILDDNFTDLQAVLNR